MLQKYLLILYKNLNEFHALIKNKNVTLYNFLNYHNNNNINIQYGGNNKGIVDAFKVLFKNIKGDIDTLVSQRDLYKENIKEYEINAIIKLKIIKILVDLYNKAKNDHTISDTDIDRILQEIYEKLKGLKLNELSLQLEKINSDFDSIL